MIFLEKIRDVTANCFIEGVLWMVPAVVIVLLSAIFLHYFPYGSEPPSFDCAKAEVAEKAFGKSAL
jgi:hypothetical protein